MSQDLINQEHVHQKSKVILWSKRILECKNSGKTVSEWCIENRISEKTYWRWHKNLKDMYKEQEGKLESSEPEFYEITPPAPTLATADVLATIHINQYKVDILSSDATVLSNIFKALRLC